MHDSYMGRKVKKIGNNDKKTRTDYLLELKEYNSKRKISKTLTTPAFTLENSLKLKQIKPLLLLLK